MLRPETKYGLLFHPNLQSDGRRLGFSFSSNRFGLRGPSAQAGSGVVLGTSFAMGLSVDDGHNWYDLCLDESSWLNVGMPVGPKNHRHVLDDIYQGSYENAVYIYHPNIWKLAKVFWDAERQGKDVFSYLGWKTGLMATAALYPKWVVKEMVKMATGLSLYADWNGRAYHFNPVYNYLDANETGLWLTTVLDDLKQVFDRFKNVIVVKVPIKEEVVNDAVISKKLERLRRNYEDWWQIFTEHFQSTTTIAEIDPSMFVSTDFHPFDTHWAVSGNRKFARMLSSILMDCGIDGVRMPE